MTESRYPWLRVFVVAALIVAAIITVGNVARGHYPSCQEDEIKVRYQIPGNWHCKNAQEYVYEQICNNKPAYPGVTVTRRACRRNTR